MSLDTLLEAAPGTRTLRARSPRTTERAVPASDTATSGPAFKRLPATELLKALLGIRARQQKEMTNRVSIRMSVVKPTGRNAVSLWLNGRDSLA